MKIREVSVKDAESLLSLFQSLDSETEFMIFEPNERTTTVEEQIKILSGFESDSSKTMLVAVDPDIVGFCVLVRGQQSRVKHVASLVIGVRKDQWGKAIGAKLMEQVLQQAEGSGVKRIELTVHVNNESAINLYKKYGFAIEGERVSSINLNGNIVNEYYMAKI